MPALAPESYEAYDIQRSRVQGKVAARGRGAQTDASYDLRIPPTKISQVLTGQLIDQALLASLEEWVDYEPGKK